MFASTWTRHLVAAVAATLASVACLTAAIGPATQPATQSGLTLAARVVA